MPPPVRWQVVDRMHLVLAESRRILLPQPLVSPLMNGGVRLEWRSSKGHKVRVEISNIGSVILSDLHRERLQRFNGFNALRVASMVAQALGTPMPSKRSKGSLKPDDSR